MKHANIQQQAYQPRRQRVRKHAHTTPQKQPKHTTKAETSFQARVIKFAVVAFLAYALVPMAWLNLLVGAMQ